MRTPPPFVSQNSLQTLLADMLKAMKSNFENLQDSGETSNKAFQVCVETRKAMNRVRTAI
jgi:hypothetical protein